MMDFDYESYNDMREAPTIGKGADAIGMKNLW